MQEKFLFLGELNYAQMKSDSMENKGKIYTAYLARGKTQEEQGKSRSVIHQCHGQSVEICWSSETGKR